MQSVISTARSDFDHKKGPISAGISQNIFTAMNFILFLKLFLRFSKYTLERELVTFYKFIYITYVQNYYKSQFHILNYSPDFFKGRTQFAASQCS